MASARPVRVSVMGPAACDPSAVAARVVERLRADGVPDVVIEVGPPTPSAADASTRSRRSQPDLAVLCQPQARVREVGGGDDGDHADLLAWERLLHDQPTLIVPTALLSHEEITAEVCAAVDDARGRCPAPPGCRRPWISRRQMSAVATVGATSALALLLHPASRRSGLLRTPIGPLAMAGSAVATLPFCLDEMGAQLQVDWDGFAMWRSHSRRRWVVVLSRRNTVVGVVKVAPRSDRTLAREAQVLTEVGTVAADVVLPAVMAATVVGEWRAVLFSALVPDRPEPAVLEDAIRVCVALRWSRNGFGLTHGDVATWNLVRFGEGRIGLLDWEMADLRFVPGYDLLHYLHVTGGLGGLGPRRPVEALEDLPAPAAEAVSTYLAATELELAEVLPAIRQFTS